MKVSVIIANYNHGGFVGEAISSALAVDWPDKEVIVVDDASTDNSRIIIKGFQGRVAAYFRPKSHQRGAHIFGFDQSTGDIIIFLDSDDFLEPEVMREVAKVWRPGISKVQYRMKLIDATGRDLGSAIPQFPAKDNPEKLRRDYLRAIAYTTSPGTGNAYSRDFLAKAYAISVPSTIRWSDSVLTPLAPLLGDVLTIRKPLARFRCHSTEEDASTSLAAAKLGIRLQQDIETARLLVIISQRTGLMIRSDPLGGNPQHIQNRLASYLVEYSAHPFPEDTKFFLIRRLIYLLIKSSQLALRTRAILLVWTIMCAMSPRKYCRNLILWRFVATSRPEIIRTILGAMSSRGSTRPRR